MSVRLELDGAVAWVLLDRPEARNALNRAVRDGLRTALEQVEADDSIAVAVLAAQGEDFCSGGDLKEMVAEGLRVPPPDYVPILGRNVHVTKPVIAAVHGRAFGGGFLLAQMCDLCLASEDAQFGITEARWGRGAPWAAPLPALVPPRIALEMLMTAEPIGAARAYEVGLVNRVVAPAALRDEAGALAARIAANAPLSVRAGKALVHGVLGRPPEEGYTIGDALYEPVYLSEDAQEGPRAFREKRAPRWQAR